MVNDFSFKDDVCYTEVHVGRKAAVEVNFSVAIPFPFDAASEVDKCEPHRLAELVYAIVNEEQH